MTRTLSAPRPDHPTVNTAVNGTNERAMTGQPVNEAATDGGGTVVGPVLEGDIVENNQRSLSALQVHG